MNTHSGDEWLELALLAALPKLPAFTPQGLAIMLWALAALQGAPPLSLLEPVLNTVIERAPAFNAQVLGSGL